MELIYLPQPRRIAPPSCRNYEAGSGASTERVFAAVSDFVTLPTTRPHVAPPVPGKSTVLSHNPDGPAGSGQAGPGASPGGEPASGPGRHGVGRPIGARVLLLSLVLIPLNAWWLTEIEYIRYSDNATTQALFFNAISLLLVLLALNGFMGRWCPRFRFSRAEMVALYVVVAAASNLAGHDQLQILFTTITYVFRRATPETGWGTRIIPYLPKSLVVGDPEAVRALYIGNSTLYRWDHIQPWLVPLGWWTLFAMLVVWTMLCLVALFRRQWDYERLTYPIAEIPILVLTNTDQLLRSRALQIGFLAGAACEVINLAHSLYPALPGIPTGVQYFHSDIPPWSAAGPIPVSSFPFAYGLTFLLPTQLGFSCWFFFMMSRIELVVAGMFGHTDWNKFPYVQQQSVGAIFGVFLAILAAARGHLRQAWTVAWRREQGIDDRDEPLSYRTAFLGLFAGMAGMVTFAVFAGMQCHTAVLYLGILFVIVLVVARLRAELGLPTYELYQTGADQVLQRVAGTGAWTRGDLIGMTLFFWLSRTHRQFPMQTQLDAVRLGHRTGTPLRSLSVVLILASGFGIVCAFWAFLHSTYAVGYESAKFRGPAVWAFGDDPWNKLNNWLSSPQQPDTGAMGAYGFGLLFTLLLVALRARFVWWPFHPVGYLVSGSFGLFRLWVPIFVSWLLKVLILRYGGLHGYRRALPFFLGLVLGEFSAGFIRTIIDLSFGLYLPPESGIGGL